MKVVNIDFENKFFETEDGEQYPLMFDANSSISLVDFQKIIDKSQEIIKEMNSED